MNTSFQNEQQVAYEILTQLGGKRFLAMTGAKNLFTAGITGQNKNFWIRMDLPNNQAKVNRLKITLCDNDTYTMEFYKQTITKSFDVVISNKQIFEGVYCDMLQDIFTKVTGLYTKF